MGRPKSKDYSLKEKLLILKKSGVNTNFEQIIEEDYLDEESIPDSLDVRIQKMLNIIKKSPIKATEMLALIMYDIENSKVRTLIAKYLLKKGCVRIQKSVYLLRAENKYYREIVDTMKEIQGCYDNSDSIILVPIPVNTPGSMQIIGKDLQIETLVNKPNILYF